MFEATGNGYPRLIPNSFQEKFVGVALFARTKDEKVVDAFQNFIDDTPQEKNSTNMELADGFNYHIDLSSEEEGGSDSPEYLMVRIVIFL